LMGCAAEFAKATCLNAKATKSHLGYYGISWEYVDVNGLCMFFHGKS